MSQGQEVSGTGELTEEPKMELLNPDQRGQQTKEALWVVFLRHLRDVDLRDEDNWNNGVQILMLWTNTGFLVSCTHVQLFPYYGCAP